MVNKQKMKQSKRMCSVIPRKNEKGIQNATKKQKQQQKPKSRVWLSLISARKEASEPLLVDRPRGIGSLQDFLQLGKRRWFDIGFLGTHRKERLVLLFDHFRCCCRLVSRCQKQRSKVQRSVPGQRSRQLKCPFYCQLMAMSRYEELF